MADIQSATAEIRRLGEDKRTRRRKIDRNHRAKI